MPIYEYLCPICRVRFERLRPLSQSDAPATCPAGHEGAPRAISRFVTRSGVKPGDAAYDSSYFGEHGPSYHEHDVYSTPPGMDDHGHGHRHGSDTHTH
ncbi:MAG: zinc ribbon domain-containing protein [Chloroflexi bacterium]|nr:zinc ribbon domain-containing protein [Chloroflexota bacterium]